MRRVIPFAGILIWPLGFLLLVACQSNVPIVHQDSTPAKARPFVLRTEACRNNMSPQCEFFLRKRELNDRLNDWILTQCTQPSNTSQIEECIRAHYKTAFLPTASAERTCPDGRYLAAQLICLSDASESYDLTMRAGMQRAQTFDWSNWTVSESAAMDTLRQQSEQACLQGGAVCFGEQLAQRLALPSADLAVCSAEREKVALEGCLVEAHGYRFLERAASKLLPSSVPEG